MKWLLCGCMVIMLDFVACRNGDSNISEASLPAPKGPSDTINTNFSNSLSTGAPVAGTGSNTGSLTTPDTVVKFASPLIDTPFKKTQ